MGTAKVTLLGEELTLQGEEDAAYLERLASDVEGLLKRLAADLELTGQPTKTALLVAINLMDELTKLRARHARLEAGTAAAASSMLTRIEHTLRLEEIPAQ
ncbi:MAG: cell division protein ZapA [bacterium]